MNEEIIEILLIEDNKRDADLTTRALKKRNVTSKIKWLKDGAEAMDYLFYQGAYKDRSPISKPKVILLDLKMPKVNGLELLKQIRSAEKTKNIPVVMLTSSSEEKDIIESYELGVNSYIVKPVDFTKFMDAVADVGLYWLLLNKPVN